MAIRPLHLSRVPMRPCDRSVSNRARGINPNIEVGRPPIDVAVCCLHPDMSGPTDHEGALEVTRYYTKGGTEGP